MPNIIGNVIYDQNRLLASTQGISNVPVCLYNESTGFGAVALTDTNGQYTFSNVLAGSYRIIECWGTSGTLTPIDFQNTATAMAIPVAKDPPITAVISPPPAANKLDSLSPNTIFITVQTSDIVNNNFYDGPIEDRPLTILGGTLSGPNLITAANNGDWGILSDGSPVNDIPYPNPYPGLTTGLIYVGTYPPTYQTVTYDNITRGYTDWWQLANHTTGMETGRMIVVNGANPGAVFFRDTVTVQPGKFYALTTWIVNMNNPTQLPPLSQPAMGIKVIAPDGTVLFNQTLNQLPATNPPQWTQIGGVVFNESYTNVTVELTTQNPNPSGNDFSVDDIVIREVVFEDMLTVSKTVNKCAANKGDTVTYTVVVENINAKDPALNVFFKDILQSGNTFVSGSIKVNGISTGYESADPNTGFNLGDMNANQKIVITFDALITQTDSNPVLNIATASYDIFVSQSGDVFKRTIESNETTINTTLSPRFQAMTDLIESVALEQTALSHILNAEGEKLQKAIALNLSADELLKFNNSIVSMVNSIYKLEVILSSKLDTFDCNLCEDECK